LRILLYTGKGGVGKTSIAAATGLRLAELGHRTLVMSIDPAHSLADSFDLDRRLMDHNAGAAISLEPNLDIQEIQIQEEIQRYWKDVYSYISTVLQVSGIQDVVAEELAIFPGMEEICSLLYINQYARERTYDVVILDCAPTAESLRFISIPTTLDWYMTKLFKLQRLGVSVARPFVKKLANFQLPDEKYFDNVESLFDRLNGIDAILRDATQTTVRLVTNPEKMVLKETQRAFMYFCLYGLTIDGVIINRVLPPEADGAFVAHWRETQQAYLSSIEDVFASVPIRRVPLFEQEVLGREGLMRLAKTLYGDDDPSQAYADSAPIRFSRDGSGTVVSLRLPFVKAADIDLSVYNDELVVRVGSFKRHLSLPRNLIGMTPSGAKRNGEWLDVLFPPTSPS
jgi:arsenite-transporting ATPase